MINTTKAFAFIAILTLVACAKPPVPDVVGQPVYHGVPTTLSPKFTSDPLPMSVDRSRQDYLKSGVPLYFFIEENGRHATWWMCNSAGDCDVDLQAALARARSYCENVRLGSKCYLDMVGITPLGPKAEEAKGYTYTHWFAEDVERKGVDDAKGLIIHFPGYNGWMTDRPNFWRREEETFVPRHIRGLGARNWDVQVVNLNPTDRAYLYDENGLLAAVAKERISEARALGYDHVILSGHSRGGSEVVRAIGAGAKPDAVILSEPTGLGPDIGLDGEDANYGNRRITSLTEHLDKARDVPVLMAWFAKSSWFDRVGKDAFDDSAKDRQAPLSLLARPAGFTGHGAVGYPRFDAVWGGCIDQFISGGDFDDCIPNQVDEDDPAMWATAAPLIKAGFKKFEADEVKARLLGKVMCKFDPVTGKLSKQAICTLFEEDQRLAAGAPGIVDNVVNIAPIEYTEDGYCKYDNVSVGPPEICFSMYFKDDLVVISPRGAQTIYWQQITDRKELSEMDWTCESYDGGYSCERTGEGDA
ncbi:MAG: hypothetical protein ACPGGK_00585 [Pikeienuella sp.]